MIGDTVGAEFEQPNNIPSDVIFNAGTTIVTSGPSNPLSSGTNTLNFTDGKVTLTWSTNGIYQTDSFSGWMLYDNTHAFTGASLASSNISGFTASDVFFSGGDVFVNLESLHVSSSSQIVVNLTTTASAPLVSEPPSLAIMAFALGAIGFRRRARRA